MSLQAKVEMLDNLLDIEVAYSLLRGGSDDSSKDPIDVNYEKLKTDIQVTGPALSEASSALTPSAWSPDLHVCPGLLESFPAQGLGLNPGLAVASQVLSLESRRPFPDS